MRIKKYLKLWFSRPKELSNEHTWKRIFALKISVILSCVVLLLFATAAFAQAPILTNVIGRFTKPTLITQSSSALPQNVQQAIKTLANQQIKQEQAKATLSINTSADNVNQPEVGLLEELFATNPADKAKIRIRKIDGRIRRLQTLLIKDKSDTAITEAANLIAEIGQETDKIVNDPATQTDREVLTLQIEQYNRIQLIVQQLEDALPMNAYLKIEDARKKYLVVTASKAINNAPNLDAVHNIAVGEIAKVVGDDFAELKAIEIISDFESSVKPEAKEKLLGLERELAIEFEKKMLKLPRDVRNRKLQDYMQYSFGDPLLQIRSIERMKDQMNDREIILGLNSLKELAMKRFIDRIFELDNQEAVNQYTDRVLQNPEDLKILTEMELVVNSGRDEDRKQKLLQMRQSVEGRVAKFFASGDLESYFKQQENRPTDILDVLLISNLNTIVSSTPGVPNELKQKFASIKNKTQKDFIDKISVKDFVTKSNLTYNPVSANADVRILLASPQAIKILQVIKNESNALEKTKIDTAIKAESAILQEHILTQVNDPEVFEDYSAFIENNQQVKQILQANLGKNFFTNLSKKSQVIQKIAREEEQKQYEIMQQIVQSIFISKNQTDFERQLPTQIQQQISQLKKQLPDKNIPQITVPVGVRLPKTAKLSDSIEQAIVHAAKQRIKDKKKSEAVKLDLTVSAKDLDVSDPIILPDSPFYPIKKLVRTMQLALTFDPLQRVQILIRQDNDKTLEAAKLLEKSSSRQSINLALTTLAEVENDFAKLKENSAKLDKLKAEGPEQSRWIDQIVDLIIKNGLARQTVFSSIEDKVYGADYVKVEKIRQNVLKDGVESLLQLTGGDAKVLVQKLEVAVNAQSGSKFKELKAIELLTEIKRFQPKKIDQILEASEIRLVKQFETHLLAIEKKQREEELLAYAESLPGNPVRQFEAYEQLKDNFINRETLLLAEGLKDKAVENLRDQVAEITDGETIQEFADVVVGSKPEDLKIITEIELRVETPHGVDGIVTPIEQKIEDIKADVEQNVIDAIISDPTSLSESDLFSNPSNTDSVSVIDVIVVKELEDLLERTPEVPEEVVDTVQELAQETINQFIESVSTTTGASTESVQVLDPAPVIIAELEELKEDAPPLVDAQIDVAIKVQVELIEEYLTTQVTDPATFETYIAQIQQDPVVIKTITSVGGSEFTQAIEETAQEITTTAENEQVLLEETIAEVTEEIFSDTSSSEIIIETLPQGVQEEIQQVKEEIATEQIPVVEVTVTVSEPAPVQIETTVPAPDVAPPPAETDVKPQEETQSDPAPEAPAAPAVPGL